MSVKMVLKNWQGPKKKKKSKKESNLEEGKLFPSNFYIVDFGDSFWREKNARLERELNSQTVFKNPE